MIKLLTEELFKKPEKIRTEFGNWEKILCIPFPDQFNYFEKDGIQFSYLQGIHYFVFPEDCNLTAEDIITDEIDFSDWKLDKISDKPNKKYILNWYFKYYAYELESSDIEAESGEYKLSNQFLNYERVFSINSISRYSWRKLKEIYICFEEKMKIPFDETKIINIDKFIRNFVWIKIKKLEKL